MKEDNNSTAHYVIILIKISAYFDYFLFCYDLAFAGIRVF